MKKAKEVKAILGARTYVLISVAVGISLIIVFLLTAKTGSKYIVGTDEYGSAIRPWSIRLHALWIELLGRSLFLTVVFTDLLLLVNLSMWKHERLFAQTPEAAEYEEDMENLSAMVAPPKRRRDLDDEEEFEEERSRRRSRDDEGD